MNSMGTASKLKLKKIVESRADAEGYLQHPGDAVLIKRGSPRWLLLACPCGCGAELPINLDARAGKAWRLYMNPKTGITVFPSIWRDTDCESHFIIWRDRITLCGGDFDDYSPYADRRDEMLSLADQIKALVPKGQTVEYVTLADQLGEIPWDVLDALRHLARAGLMNEGRGNARGSFTRVK